MDPQFTNEKQLLADIDQLREQFPQTQDLYREVCTLLFFRYGMTPTANKLYQLVRKGSMTAPADALTRFWEDLREKSRVRIEHPDLPEALKSAAGELTAALWTSAQSLAHETLQAYQQEAKTSVAEARAASSAAEQAIASHHAAYEKALQDLQQAALRAEQLEQKLAAAQEQLGDLRHNIGVLEGSLQVITANRDELAGVLQQLREKPPAEAARPIIRAVRSRKKADSPTADVPPETL